MKMEEMVIDFLHKMAKPLGLSVTASRPPGEALTITFWREMKIEETFTLREKAENVRDFLYDIPLVKNFNEEKKRLEKKIAELDKASKIGRVMAAIESMDDKQIEDLIGNVLCKSDSRE